MNSNRNKIFDRDPKLDEYMSGEVVLSPIITFEWDCPCCEEHVVETGHYEVQYVSCPDCMKWFRYTYADEKNE